MTPARGHKHKTTHQHTGAEVYHKASFVEREADDKSKRRQHQKDRTQHDGVEIEKNRIEYQHNIEGFSFGAQPHFKYLAKL
jgi:23S rRNA G2069 N7-methylase RlmK/C1962 C5-methylase RlmI